MVFFFTTPCGTLLEFPLVEPVQTGQNAQSFVPCLMISIEPFTMQQSAKGGGMKMV